MADVPPLATPLVWLLTDDQPGNRTHVVGAARALGWPAVEKRLGFNERARKATPLLGATLDTLDGPSRAIITPPFPDLVIAAGRRSVPVARWIKRASGGRARVVLIGRKTPDVADLTIRYAYFQQVPRPNLVQLALPLTKVDPETLAETRANEPDPLEGMERPRVVFLVGGPTAQHALGRDFAARMAGAVADATAALGGGLAIATSRRTPADAVEAIRQAAPEARLHVWRADAAYNPYVAFLANADLLVVTGESEAMLAEAIAAEKPLTIYPLEAVPLSRISRVRGRIASLAQGKSPLAPAARALMASGWVNPRRDLNALHRLIESRGWGRVFDGALNQTPPAPHQDERRALGERMAALVRPRRDGASLPSREPTA